MLKSLIKVALIMVVSIGVSKESNAWGTIGHRVVGEIASSYLNAKAKKEIQAILGNETIAMASNWPDFIKSDSNYKYLNPWHYVDIEKNLSYNAAVDSMKADTGVNAYNRIKWLTGQLKDKSLSLNQKQMYLKLLIHIVGDIHQPLHAGRKGDRGGNDIKVTWFGENSNLHKVWDESLITYQELSYTEYTTAINFTTVQQRTTWQKDPLEKWLFESYEISERLHDDVKPGDKLGYNYNFKHVATLNSQLLKGGVRLAGLLNEIFG